MKKIIVVFISLFTIAAIAQQEKDWFASANALYKKGKYQDAIADYMRIEKSGKSSSELYFNLGNCYYKLNKVAPTIYNYEKALQLNSDNQDAKNNLIFANRLTIDRIEPLTETIFQKLRKNVLSRFQPDTWAVITVVLSVLLAVFFLTFYFSSTPAKRRLFFSLSILCFFLFMVSFLVAYGQYSYHKNKREAIVFSSKAVIQSEPIQDAETVFTLHEGTKVAVVDQVDQWKKIKLIDGKTGWVLAKFIKEI